jgi:hypothetical protein
MKTEAEQIEAVRAALVKFDRRDTNDDKEIAAVDAVVTMQPWEPAEEEPNSEAKETAARSWCVLHYGWRGLSRALSPSEWSILGESLYILGKTVVAEYDRKTGN